MERNDGQVDRSSDGLTEEQLSGVSEGDTLTIVENCGSATLPDAELPPNKPEASSGSSQTERTREADLSPITAATLQSLLQEQMRLFFKEQRLSREINNLQREAELSASIRESNMESVQLALGVGEEETYSSEHGCSHGGGEGTSPIPGGIRMKRRLEQETDVIGQGMAKKIRGDTLVNSKYNYLQSKPYAQWTGSDFQNYQVFRMDKVRQMTMQHVYEIIIPNIQDIIPREFLKGKENVSDDKGGYKILHTGQYAYSKTGIGKTGVTLRFITPNNVYDELDDNQQMMINTLKKLMNMTASYVYFNSSNVTPQKNLVILISSPCPHYQHRHLKKLRELLESIFTSVLWQKKNSDVKDYMKTSFHNRQNDVVGINNELMFRMANALF